MVEINRVARSMTGALKIAKALGYPWPMKCVLFYGFGPNRVKTVNTRKELAEWARVALDASLSREMWVGGADEEVVWPPQPPYRPHAYYNHLMDILTIRTRDVTTVSNPAGDPDDYFDLLYGVREDGSWDQIVGIQIWGFSGLMHAQSPWKMYDQLKKARKKRAEAKQQKQP